MKLGQSTQTCQTTQSLSVELPCKLLNIKWQDKIQDTEVLKKAGLQSIPTLLQKSQVRWAGHVVLMPENRLPKQLLYRELCSGKRKVGGQKKRFRDSLKISLGDLGISTATWESDAQDRLSWHGKTTKGANAAEARRIAEAERKRTLRKSQAASTPLPTSSLHTCPACGRDFRARIGLISRLRTHRSISTNQN